MDGTALKEAFTKSLEQAAQRFQDEGQPCVGCGCASESVGVFVPDDPQRYGAPEGKCRMIFYAVCASCMGNNIDMVEAALEYYYKKPRCH